MLQRLTEDLEYHELLDRAAKCESSLEQLCYVAAFTVSSYSTTVFRTSKPFNPLLGETYELDRLEESGYRSLCEQVSHHPPAAAHHADSKHGWTLRQEIKITSKFRGKYLSIMPLGTIHCVFHASGNHYTWKKVTTTVHNIIVGKLWIDQVGEIEIVNHKTGDKCNLKFVPYSYFSRDVARKVGQGVGRHVARPSVAPLCLGTAAGTRPTPRSSGWRRSSASPARGARPRPPGPPRTVRSGRGEPPSPPSSQCSPSLRAPRHPLRPLQAAVVRAQEGPGHPGAGTRLQGRLLGEQREAGLDPVPGHFLRAGRSSGAEACGAARGERRLSVRPSVSAPAASAGRAHLPGLP
uniref:Oxysterol-binding protein n=1 Tax=Anas platyrhynchos platyrhynchos TaxID=8840 RepID=A0A493U3D6_ANAPP